ncbi:isomerase [Streptomyces hygroscopicus]|uniref:2-hydroxychromene-2-carboxylate isomerase n=1 Tax=Streptomyces hygroscopicus TaxID=1912 RepID=UPI00223F7B1D|nr:DsbA family protein [Streptomyces hygroscopicus]MCW7944041.1 isomerase [Streptomyces hygroscopicus]
MAKPSAKPPRWYFSLRSPYSWFAYRDLMDRYRDVADALEWIPCWEPDDPTARLLGDAGVELPWVPMSRAKNFYVLQDARRLAHERGLTMTWPIDRDPHWDVAHLGHLAAEQAGLGRAYVDLVYRARWEHGRDICDRAVIGDIAVQLGLERDRLAAACDSPRLQRAGADVLTRSYHDGAFGVPFFILGREKYFGTDRLPAFVRAFRETYAAPPDALPNPASDEPLAGITALGLDAGHAGGCG